MHIVSLLLLPAVALAAPGWTVWNSGAAASPQQRYERQILSYGQPRFSPLYSYRRQPTSRRQPSVSLRTSQRQPAFRSGVTGREGTNAIPTDVGGFLNKDSPSLKSAAAFFVDLSGFDTCGRQAKVYMDAILTGKSPADASAAATKVYREDYAKGERLVAGSACEASDLAWRQAVREGTDPMLSSALAFVTAYKSDSPCLAAAKDYMIAVKEGKTHLQANKISTKAFGAQLRKLSAEGKKTIDPTCAQTALDYASALPVKPSPPNAAAMRAFMEKALDLNNGFHPVCWRAAEKFFESYDNNNNAELTNNYNAARAFISAYRSEPQDASKSPCAAATLAYTKAIAEEQPAKKNAASMVAFIEESIRTGGVGADPVCEAAADTYFDVFLGGGSDEEATEAASLAFITAVDRNPSYKVNSACGQAASAYMEANF